MKKRELLAKKEFLKVRSEVHHEEKVIFHEFLHLKRHHQAICAFLIIVGIVFIWRGIWNLMDRLWLPNYPLASHASGLVIGILILFLTHELMKAAAP